MYLTNLSLLSLIAKGLGSNRPTLITFMSFVLLYGVIGSSHTAVTIKLNKSSFLNVNVLFSNFNCIEVKSVNDLCVNVT